jgi:hypothetical protein
MSSVVGVKELGQVRSWSGGLAVAVDDNEVGGGACGAGGETCTTSS